MADISQITVNNTTYDLKDATARSNSGVTGVKGDSESSYRTGNVNITLANIGIHVGTTAPANVTTATVPVGELYIYIGS